MTRAQIKEFRNLQQRKYRKQNQTYIVEGAKNVYEWLQDPQVTIRHIIALPEWIASHQELLQKQAHAAVITALPHELEKISALQHAQQVLITVACPPEQRWIPRRNAWYLFLEHIQDPGNMGTIIRTADWFGLPELLLSPDCVEVYNPKVVQATMGSLLRVTVHTCSATELLTACQNSQIPVYATTPEGENLLQSAALAPGIIALGNESAGLSQTLLQETNRQLRIPGKGGAESLNVGVAAGILCAQLIGG